MANLKKTRRRLPRSEREKLIVEEAVRFFSEVGFEGKTRALAQRLDITQPLLYRYFRDKETLLKRVTEEVYFKNWKPEFGAMLRDRTTPIGRRLTRFYQNYFNSVLTPELVRLFMYAGLRGFDLDTAHTIAVAQNVLMPMCIELRHEYGLPDATRRPIGRMEMEVVGILHGAVFWFAVRKHINGPALPDDIDALIECTVKAFIEGCGPAMHAASEGKGCAVGAAAELNIKFT